MTANQIARLTHLTTQSFIRGELTLDEYTSIIQALSAQAREAGIAEEAAKIYWELCQGWLNRRAA